MQFANTGQFTRVGVNAALPAEIPSALLTGVVWETEGKQDNSALAGNLRHYLHISTQKERTNAGLSHLPGFEFLAA